MWRVLSEAVPALRAWGEKLGVDLMIREARPPACTGRSIRDSQDCFSANQRLFEVEQALFFLCRFATRSEHESVILNHGSQGGSNRTDHCWCRDVDQAGHARKDAADHLLLATLKETALQDARIYDADE